MFRSTLAVLALSLPMIAIAEVTTTERAGEAVEDAGKSVRKAGRAASDKACPLVNGKADCTKKRVMHKIENGKDEIKDKADDVKKKID